ncbi:hypothetical protein KUV75_10140 [Qipengyuania gaetbuli]|uniref:hypothetical protein n=1 Tax=Qipengyuania gaetbuli TaxID=266952 RepID=UPI001C99E9DD|nr:hypothetical protein [Qipengyuania gaetbuli]MBY6015253.1 hypothetical protein [Qipengyuania gaetbuli]
MPGSDRRSVVRALGALAVLPMLPAPLAAATRTRPAFPSAALVLERTLDRHLANNALIRVTRSWSCTFRALGAGAVVDASQISAKVEAPPSLAAFARMEEARDASAIFPVQLDRSGLIVGWDEETGPDIGTAVARAMDVIEAAVANPGGATGSAILYLVYRQRRFRPRQPVASRPVLSGDGAKRRNAAGHARGRIAGLLRSRHRGERRSADRPAAA